MLKKLLFITILTLTFYSGVRAQNVVLHFNPIDTTAEVGSIVNVSVEATGMTAVAAVQLNFQFDSTVVEFQGPDMINIHPVFSTGLGVGMGNTTADKIEFQWFDTNNHDFSGTKKLFDIPFKILKVGSTDLVFTETTISNAALDPYTVGVDTATITGTGLTVADPLVLSVTSVSQDMGSDSCVDVKVESGFVDITRLDFSLGWTSSIASYQSVTNLNATLGLAAGNFDISQTGSGNLGFTFTDVAGKDLAVGDVLFSACYTATGAQGSSTPVAFGATPTAIVVENSAGAIDNTFSDGSFAVNSTAPAGIYTFSLPDTVGSVGDQICLPLTIDNFVDFTSVGFTMTWDTTILDFVNATQIEDPNNPPQLLGDFYDLASTDTGSLGYLFFDFLGNTRTLPNNSALVNVCFDVVGEIGDVSPLNFATENPGVSVVDANGNEAIFDTINGTFTIPAIMLDTFTMFGDYIDCTQGVSVGDTMAIDIYADNFTDLSTIQLDMLYDTSKLEYLSAMVNINYDLFPPVAPSNANDKLLFLWLAPSDENPYSWPVNSPMFTLKFKVKAGAIGDDVGIVFDNVSGITGPNGDVPYLLNNIAIEIAESLVINSSMTDLTCGSTNDGAITLSPTGGAGAYTYTWSGPNGPYSGNSLTGLGAGTYAVTVESCNLIQEETFVLTEHPGFLLSLSNIKNETSPPGGNGEITVAPSVAGTYTYSWTGPGGPYTGNALVDLVEGTYTVVATDTSGCTATLPVGLNKLTASGTFENPTCNSGNNGSILLAVSSTGGNSTFSYQWNMGPGGANPTNLTAGTYNVTVSDQTDAQIELSFVLIDPPAMNIQLDGTVSTVAGQSDGGVNITPSGGTPNGSAPFYTYLWSPGGATTEDLSGVGVGNYSVVVTDANGCTQAGGPYSVSSFGAPNPTIVLDSVDCNGGGTGKIRVISVTNGVPDYTVSIAGVVGSQTTDGTFEVFFDGLTAGSYTMTIVDANSTDTTFNVTVLEPMVLGISNVVISPSSGSNGAISYDVIGGTPSYSYDWNGTANDGVEDISNLTSGSYSVTVTDAHSCSVTQAFTVGVADVPIPTVEVTDPTCNGALSGVLQVTSIVGDNPDYTVSVAGYGSQVTNGLNAVTFNGLGAGSYGVTVVDNIGSDTIFTVSVGEPAPITISNIVALDEITPPGSNGSINVDVVGGVGSYSYQWSPGGMTTEDITGLVTGTYQLTVVDGNGCVKESGAIDVGLEMATFSCGTEVFDATCPDTEDGAVDLTVFGGVNGLTYKWTKEGVSGIYSTLADLTGVGAGVYHVTVTDGVGSVTTCDATVGQKSYLTGSINVLSSYNGYNVSGFGQADGEAIALPLNGSTPYQYAWSTTPVEVTATATTLVGGINSVTITDNLGCSIELTTNLTQPDELTCATNSTDTPCAGTSEGAVDITVLGGVNAMAYNYNWAGPSGYTSTDGNIDNLEAGVYLVTVTDANGNTTTCNSTIGTTSNLVLNLNILSNHNGYHVSSPTAIDGVVKAEISGGVEPYQFDWSNGDTKQTADTLGAGLATVTVTDALGCVIEGTVTLTAPGVFSCSVVAENTVCPGSTDGRVVVVLSGGVMPVASYFWTGPGGPYTDSLLVGLSPGTYDVTVTDANETQTSCSGTVVQLSNLKATVQLESSETSANAADGVAQVYPSGGSTPYTFLWSNGETTEKATSLSGGVNTVTVTDALGCESIISFVMSTDGVVSAEINVLGTTCYGLCDGEATLNVMSGAAPFSYLWGNGQTGSSVSDLCAGDISVTITDVNGKVGTATATITEPDSLHIEFAVTQPTAYNICNGSVTATVSGGTPDYSYTWYDSTPATTGPTLTEKCVGKYLLIVLDENNCTAMKHVIFEAPLTDDCFEASKVMTPGVLDGSNDLFTITCLNTSSNNTLTVFSRWGRNVYSKSNYDGSWNGVDDDGNELPSGAYYWVLRYTQNGQDQTQKGHLTIIR